MTLEEVLAEWQRDATIDVDDLAQEIRRVPNLHAKYLRFYVENRAKSKRLEHELLKLRRDVTDFYTGRAEKPSPMRVLKSEAHTYVSADDAIQEAESRLEAARIAVSAVERILKMVESRGYELKTALEWNKFVGGR